MMSDEKLLIHLSFLLGVKTDPFQSIIGHRASEQKTHSDSIHMTTYPSGYMIAAWIAMEDIDEDSGPLIYYPGSHNLPYVYSGEAGITLEEVNANQDDLYKPYRQKYEPLIDEIIEDNKLSEERFIAKKGDVLIWHANLLHGGSICKNTSLSRKALVCHYFAENSFKYHDYTGVMANDFSSIFQEDLNAKGGFLSKLRRGFLVVKIVFLRQFIYQNIQMLKFQLKTGCLKMQKNIIIYMEKKKAESGSNATRIFFVNQTLFFDGGE